MSSKLRLQKQALLVILICLGSMAVLSALIRLLSAPVEEAAVDTVEARAVVGARAEVEVVDTTKEATAAAVAAVVVDTKVYEPVPKYLEPMLTWD